MHFNTLARPFIVAVALLLTLMAAPEAHSDDDAREFCWRDSQTRGVGTVPMSCNPGYERIGLFCYQQCKAGMKRVGFDCHSTCPSGMRDDGLFCRATEYGRGAGFAWQFGDPLNDDGMRSRCEARHGRGKCEKNGLIFYPKCQAGYHAVGCCVCRPNVPNCSALGLGGRLDLSCAKKVEVRAPLVANCASSKDRDAGLCYPKCSAGYDGVGPVCWSKAPENWVECGMGAAKDAATCASITFDQVASVGQIALFVGTTVATLGTSTGATAAANTAARTAQTAGKIARIKQQFATMKSAYKAIKNTTKLEAVATAAGAIKQGADISRDLETAVTPEDMARVAAMIAAIADPTGVSATAAAYTYPQCSKYFPNR